MHMFVVVVHVCGEHRGDNYVSILNYDVNYFMVCDKVQFWMFFLQMGENMVKYTIQLPW